MPNSTAAVLQPAQFSVEALNQQIRSTVVRALYHSFNDTQRQVSVRGTIGDIPATDYRVCYKVALKYGGQAVYLDIPRQVLKATASNRATTFRSRAFWPLTAGRANPAESISA